jgi:Cu(I)/Ag(I) efflux system membrane fusion protein
MKRKQVAGLGAILLIIGVIVATWWIRHAARLHPAAAMKPPAVLYWYDPMVPQQHFEKPGKSPFMDMQLVPRLSLIHI